MAKKYTFNDGNWWGVVINDKEIDEL